MCEARYSTPGFLSDKTLLSLRVLAIRVSPAYVLDKIQTREILLLLKAHDAPAPKAKKSCEADSCEALMEMYRTQEANDVVSQPRRTVYV